MSYQNMIDALALKMPKKIPRTKYSANTQIFNGFYTKMGHAVYADWILQYFQALADSDADVVMIHDDIVWTSGPFTNPSWYHKYVFPNYEKLFEPLHKAENIRALLWPSAITFLPMSLWIMPFIIMNAMKALHTEADHA